MWRVALFCLVLMASLAGAVPAQAGFTWCKSDPVIMLNGAIVDVTVDIPLEYMLLVNGPIKYDVYIPKGVTGRLVVSDPGFNLKGMTLTFHETNEKVENKRFYTTVKVSVPVDRRRIGQNTVIPARLNILPVGGRLVVEEGTIEMTSASLWITGLK